MTRSGSASWISVNRASARRAARVSVTAYFVMYGVILAVWVTRIPAIKQGLGLTDGQLGLALLALPAGVLLITLVAGRLVDRVGSARVTAAGGTAMALLLIMPALAGGLGSLSAALFAFGIGAGALNVGMNANGVLVERMSGRRVMSSLHAGYSLGALAGAVAGGLLARAGVGPLGTFLAIGLPGAALAVLAGRWLEGGSRGRAALEPDAAAAGPAAGSAAPGAGRGRLTRPGALILLLGVTGLCALLAEGAAADWSAVYLRDDLGRARGGRIRGVLGHDGRRAAGRGPAGGGVRPGTARPGGGSGRGWPAG
jgi:MFS family permease